MYISKSKIELENSNCTLEVNDCNLDNIFCCVQKGKIEIIKR